MINILVKLSEIFPLQFSNFYVRVLFYTIIGVVLLFTFLIPYFVRKGKERKAEEKAKKKKKRELDIDYFEVIWDDKHATKEQIIKALVDKLKKYLCADDNDTNYENLEENELIELNHIIEQSIQEIQKAKQKEEKKNDKTHRF